MPSGEQPKPESDERGKRGNRDENDSNQSALWFSLSGLGFEFLAALAVPAAAGWWLDKKLHCSPWLLIVGVAVGFAVGLYTIIRASNRLLK